MTYLVLYEKTETGYSAYVPDLEGCIASGSTKEEVTQLIKEAITFHIEGMQEEGLIIPEPATESALLEVA
ncbi:type II toxin-antitoxin system HicB family antitoxin [Parasediminibacterium paludis]|jgi:predicted RNase H-like HicB family nuclease|uniref:Type II toxin-antitoxin system HicB family antitoxin n=1 Tax=Parasediminibacterium paludis TaxID=908966 RepID=A0ABV8PV66_9BACT